MGFVYLIDDGRDLKIGMTGNHVVRLRDIRSANPRARMVEVFPCPNARKAEKHLKRRLGPSPYGSEWYPREDRTFDEFAAVRAIYSTEEAFVRMRDARAVERLEQSKRNQAKAWATQPTRS